MILDKIEKLLQEVSNLTAQNADEIEQLRLKYLSKKGEIAALMADFRNVSADQKKAVGMKINELKNMAIARINELKETLPLPTTMPTISTSPARHTPSRWAHATR